MEQLFAFDVQQVYNMAISSTLTLSQQYYPNSINSVFSATNHSCVPFSLFLNGLFTQMNCSLEVYVLSLLYIERFCKHHLKFVNVYSIKQVVLASVIVAQKFHDESCYKNDFYAKLDSLSPAEVSCLEEDFLRCIDYSLYVPATEYAQFYNNLCVVLNASFSAIQGSYLPPLDIREDRNGFSLSYLSSSRDAAHCTQYSHQKHFQTQFAMPVPIAMASVPFYPITAVSPNSYYYSVRDSTDDYTPCSMDLSPQWTSSSYSPTSIHYSPSSWNTVPQSNCIPCYCMPVKPLLPAVCIPIIPSLYPYPITVNPCSPHYYNEKCTVCN